MESNDLIQIVQLPVIEERLRTMKEAVDKQVSEALSLVCTADTLQAVKAKRAELNKQFQELEKQRRAVKSAVLEPWERFETTYRECIADAFMGADAQLKRKIGDVEAEIKKQCEESLREYFDELCAAHHVEFLRFEQAGIVIDMASAKAKTPKKLRERMTDFVARVATEINAIADMDDAEEILVEYKATLNLPVAITTVQERCRRIEEEREGAVARKELLEREREAVHLVEAAAPPVRSVGPTENIIRVSFTIVDTRENAIKVREFMKQEGIHYEP